MTISINTNVTSLFSQEDLNNTSMSLSDVMQQLSSGLRVNNASDDPAGYAVAQLLADKTASLNQATSNANDGISLIQTAQGSLQEVNNILQRMKELATEAANGTLSDTERSDTVQVEFADLQSEISNITSNSNFNGIQLLDGSVTSVSIQAGSTSADTFSISLTNATTGSSGLNISSNSVDTVTNAQSAMTSIDSAITTLSSGLATLGASQANLDSIIADNTSASTNSEAAYSAIMDVDYAGATANEARLNVLAQAGASMVNQANILPQLALTLLKG